MSDQASVVLVIINVEVVEVVVAMGGMIGVMAEEVVAINTVGLTLSLGLQ